ADQLEQVALGRVQERAHLRERRVPRAQEPEQVRGRTARGPAVQFAQRLLRGRHRLRQLRQRLLEQRLDLAPRLLVLLALLRGQRAQLLLGQQPALPPRRQQDPLRRL